MNATTDRSVRNQGHHPSRGDVAALAEHLAADPHFADCSYDDLEALVRAGSIVTVPAQWMFLQEGTPADALYVLLTGSAVVFHARRPVADVGPGELVGELALLHGTGRTATVTSSEPVRALRVEYHRLHTVLAQHPRLAAVLARLGETRTAPAA